MKFAFFPSPFKICLIFHFSIRERRAHNIFVSAEFRL